MNPTADSRLLVIIPDRLSQLVEKGEITERYYNPGNLFSEVHIAMTNDDRPDSGAVQKTVGDARLFLHNLPDARRTFLPSLGWRPALLGGWTRQALDLARTIRPRMIRCHGAHLNALAAHRIKQELKIPYVVSLHINPDEDVRGRGGLVKRLVTHAQRHLERVGLQGADLVMPVYRPIVPYLDRLGITRHEVCYNVLNPSHLHEKRDYALHTPVRIVSVGRQFGEKDPSHLIRAVGQLGNVELTLFGDGEYHSRLMALASGLGLGDRVRFVPAMANDELCARLPEFDIFAVHSEYWEIAKSVLEPLLTGLPVIINRRIGAPVPELTPDICMLVDNTTESYRQALEFLITNHGAREHLGRRAFAHARAHWAPDITEAKFAAIYRRLSGLGQ